MKDYIKKEYLDFTNYHKNKINLAIHVIAGIIYMSCLNLLSKEYLLPFYFLLLLFTFEDLKVTIFAILTVILGTSILKSYKLKISFIVLLFFFHCFVLPEISHLMTQESIQLNYDNISIDKFITNIVYFLPFSIKRYLSI